MTAPTNTHNYIHLAPTVFPDHPYLVNWPLVAALTYISVQLILNLMLSFGHTSHVLVLYGTI